ncbi:hypothetical protein TNCV_3339511 [Trichonephila clavipes]|nr:hypothetical protein TNCV_3339511 [Trichonephila clavipes]
MNNASLPRTKTFLFMGCNESLIPCNDLYLPLKETPGFRGTQFEDHCAKPTGVACPEWALYQNSLGSFSGPCLFASMTSEPVDVDEFDMPEPGCCTDFTDLGLTPTSAEDDEDLGVGFSGNHLDDSAVSVVFRRKRNFG